MKRIPCVIMRGGTSRGASLLAEYLPEDQTQRDGILMAIMGSGNDLEIDGIDGGSPPTSKVATISRSSDLHADVDYLFTQIIVHEQRVGAMPSCGSMLSGAGVFTAENGLIVATPPVARVRIRNVNMGTFIGADVQTPNGVVGCEDSAGIDDAPGTIAPVALTFLNIAGTKAGRIFPIDDQIDCFDSVPVTCVDIAVPIVTIPAEYLGKTGYELPAEPGADRVLLARIESTRLQAGKAMGLGDVSNAVIPKPVFIFPAQKGGAIDVCYSIPHSCHRASAITGTTAISSSCTLEDTVTRQTVPFVGYGSISIEHPNGALDAHSSNEGQDATALRAPVIRMTRKVFSGEVYPP